MKISDKGLAFVQGWEKCCLAAYCDSGGVPTIGYGHTQGVKMGDRISIYQATRFLAEDLYVAETAIVYLVYVPLNQDQFDALCSFIFNVGVSAFKGSTLLRKLNRQDYAGAALEFARWNKDQDAQGVLHPVQGLTNRRDAERQLFEGNL